MNLKLHKNIELFEYKRADLPNSIIQDWPIYSYKRKQVLFHEGHPALGVYFIESGRAKIYKLGLSGRPYILFLAGPCDFLNAECVLGSEEFETSAEMLEDGRIAFIEKDRLNALLQESHPHSLRIANFLARRLASSYEERVCLADGTVRERMAGALVQLGERYGNENSEGLCISLQLSREDLASMIGTTPGTVMRLLKEFKDEGVIRLAGKRIIIGNMEQLEGVAQIS